MAQARQGSGCAHGIRAALKSASRRTRTESASGDTAAATATYKELVTIWHGADADLPELAEAKEFVAAHP